MRIVNYYYRFTTYIHTFFQYITASGALPFLGNQVQTNRKYNLTLPNSQLILIMTQKGVNPTHVDLCTHRTKKQKIHTHRTESTNIKMCSYQNSFSLENIH